MAGEDQLPGISVIERMAAKHHEESGHLIARWDQLSIDDRKRLMDAMEASVGVISDVLELKSGTFFARIRTGVCRDGLLAEHKQAKRSVLYGR